MIKVIGGWDSEAGERVMSTAHARTIAGWMYEDELEWLFQQAQRRRVIVEIGVWKGRSTAALAAGTPGTVYGFDHWQGSPLERESYHVEVASEEGSRQCEQEARLNLARYGTRCQLARLDSAIAAQRWDQPIDMLFLDGGHDYDSVRADLAAWLPHVSDRGLVCGHDFTWEGVERAVVQTLGSVQRGPGSIWYLVKD